MIARLRRWFYAMGLRADIAGYEDDLDTIRMLGQQGGMAHALIAARLADAKEELTLCTRRSTPVRAIVN